MIKTVRLTDFAKYSRFLSTIDNATVQHTIQWSKVIMSFKKDELIILAAIEKDKIIGAVPLYVFKSKLGNIINSVPYPGPLGGILTVPTTKEKEEKIYSLLFQEVDKLAKQLNVVLVTLISSPFTNDDILYKKYFKPDFDLPNFTLFINLKNQIPTNSHFRNNLRRMLKRANLNGYNLITSRSVGDFNEWYKLHKVRQKSIGVEPIPKKLFLSALKHLVPDNKGKFFYVKDRSGKIIAGCLTTYHNKILDTYMISGNKSAYNSGAIYLLIDSLIKWATKKGYNYFNWQSSKPKNGGPYNFKIQWGSIESEYTFFTKKYSPIDKILKAGVERIVKEYKWHYVLPFSVFDKS